MISEEIRQALEKRYYPNLDEVVFGHFEEALRARLPQRAIVLDVGSGPGSWILQAQRPRLGLLVGVDVYRPDTAQLDAFALGRSEALPFAGGSFDLAAAYLVIEHLAEPLAAFCEVARVLKPGGHFVFKTPAVYTPLFLMAKVLPTTLHKRLKARVGTDEGDVFPTYYRANSVRALERNLAQAGFERAWLHTVDQTYAYLSHTHLSYAAGLLYSRLTQSAALGWLRNQIIGIYRLKRNLP